MQHCKFSQNQIERNFVFMHLCCTLKELFLFFDQCSLEIGLELQREKMFYIMFEKFVFHDFWITYTYLHTSLLREWFFVFKWNGIIKSRIFQWMLIRKMKKISSKRYQHRKFQISWAQVLLQFIRKIPCATAYEHIYSTGTIDNDNFRR